jgi:hypothetical protein
LGKLRATNEPDFNNLPDVVFSIGFRCNDKRPVEKIDGNSMWALVLCSAYPGDPAVGGHDDNGREVGLEGTVEEREAFNVKQMDLVDEEHLQKRERIKKVRQCILCAGS